jgi:hypothetical protein
MKHSDEQLAAAADLLADGATSAEAARAIADQFRVSVRTGERVVAAVSRDMSDTDPVCDTGRVDYLAAALATMHRCMVTAEDTDLAFERAERLAGVISKSKVRWSA